MRVLQAKARLTRRARYARGSGKVNAKSRTARSVAKRRTLDLCSRNAFPVPSTCSRGLCLSLGLGKAARDGALRDPDVDVARALRARIAEHATRGDPLGPQ